MYDNFYLSESDICTIKEWEKKDNVLIICGNSGVGKSLLAKEILKNKVITEIDSLSIKNNINLDQSLNNIISKDNISMMFNKEKRIDRGIIIDNLNIFHKYDKKNFKLLCKFLERQTFYKTKVICMCDSKFIINKAIKKFKKFLIHIKYNNFAYHKIINKLLKDYTIQLSFEEKNSLLIQSKYDLNRFITLIKDIKNKNIFDDFDNSTELYKKTFREDLTMENIARLFESEKLTISLNLLENVINYTRNINDLVKIYNYYEFADIYEKCILTNNTMNLYSIYTIGILNTIFKNKKMIINKFTNNKYLSQSFIYIHNDRLIKNIHRYQDNIYIYLYLYYFNKDSKFINGVLKDLDKKELDFYIKSFREFYKKNLLFRFN